MSRFLTTNQDFLILSIISALVLPEAPLHAFEFPDIANRLIFFIVSILNATSGPIIPCLLSNQQKIVGDNGHAATGVIVFPIWYAVRSGKCFRMDRWQDALESALRHCCTA